MSIARTPRANRRIRKTAAEMRTPEQINKYEHALECLEEARNLLNQISEENQADYDAEHYAAKINEIISCDHGEAGLEPYIARIS